MKYAITASESDAKTIRSDQEKDLGLSWPGCFIDGKKAGYGDIYHLYDVIKHPDGKQFAYPVSDKYESKSNVTLQDKLDDTWTTKSAIAESIG